MAKTKKSNYSTDFVPIKEIKNGNIIFEETIAEGVHDYYLHGTGCKKESYEIIQVLKNKL